MSSEAEPGASWPPAPEGQPPAVPADIPADDAEEPLHHGWRLLVLGLCCAPPIFLPLAIWQGITASRARAGAGTPLLLATAAVSALWLGAVLMAQYIYH